MPEPKEKNSNKPELIFRKDFRKVNKPVEDAKLPTKISDLTSEALSDLMLKYTAWREFTEDLCMEALTDFTRKTEQHSYKFDQTFLMMEGSTVKEKETRTRIDLEVHKLYLLLQDAELYYNLLSRKLESYNNCLTVISREITRRTNKDA